MGKRKEFDLAEVLTIGGENKPAAEFGRYIEQIKAMTEKISAAFAPYASLSSDLELMGEVAARTVDIQRAHDRLTRVRNDIGFNLIAIRKELGEEQFIEHFFRLDLLPFDKSHALNLIGEAEDIEKGKNPC